MAAASFRLKSKIPMALKPMAPNKVAKIPNCAAAPSNKVLGLQQMVWGQGLMLLVGILLLYLAIVKKFEPLLLLPIGFGAILANIPGAGIAEGICCNPVFAQSMFNCSIERPCDYE
jgi:Na+-transporting methylmalonyl-CoA/oxaloacetate decarboxylase beta subunit